MKPINEQTLEERKAHLILEEPCIEGSGYNFNGYYRTTVISEHTKSGFSTVLTHRLNLMQHLGITNPGSRYHACRACTNRGCVNPKHCYFGTAADNKMDVPAHKRAAGGAAYRSKGMRVYVATTPEGQELLCKGLAALERYDIISSMVYTRLRDQPGVVIERVRGYKAPKDLGWSFRSADSNEEKRGLQLPHASYVPLVRSTALATA